MNSLESLGQHTLVALELLATAAFALSGVMGAMRKRLDIVGVCVCGFLAAFGGGTLRDLVCNEIPTLFRDHRPYAVCAFAGGISYAGLTWLGLADTPAIAACALVTTGLRCLTLWHDWRLPTQLS